MSSAICWECGNTFANDEVFDIPIFRKGWTVKWCLNCAMKQLQMTDYRLVTKSNKYKRIHIKSSEEYGTEFATIVKELKLCYENQIRKIRDFDEAWDDIHNIATDIIYGDAP